MTLETPLQKRKRRLMINAYKVYKAHELEAGVYRMVAGAMCISENTARRWVAKMKDKEDNER